MSQYLCSLEFRDHTKTQNLEVDRGQNTPTIEASKPSLKAARVAALNDIPILIVLRANKFAGEGDVLTQNEIEDLLGRLGIKSLQCELYM